ncbi:MAG: carboxymuconolactone decarboxylase family protein [Candidatus Thorarchaeota archaeon]|jgi:AhpD family alkylhydroperoxidase
MGKYEDTLKDIETTLGIVPDYMGALAEDVLIQEWPLMKKYVVGESKIPGKYRELIGLAIAANTRCPYCTLFHTAAAQLHGASDDEIQEIYFLASFTGRWSSMLFAQQYDLEKFTEEAHKIGAHLSK